MVVKTVDRDSRFLLGTPPWGSLPIGIAIMPWPSNDSGFAQGGGAECQRGILGAGLVDHVGDVAVGQLHAPHLGPRYVWHDGCDTSTAKH